jgi:hypothetical protein
MNGFPLLGLDDFVHLSDFVNDKLGDQGRHAILDYTGYRDRFGNFLNVRKNQLRVTGNATLSLTNANVTHGDLIVDSGVLRLAVGNNGGGGRVFITVGEPRRIFVNRYGMLNIDRNGVAANETNAIGDSVEIRLASVAGTRADAIAGSNFPATVPLGLYLSGNTGQSRNEKVGNLYFDSGANYLTMVANSNLRQRFEFLSFQRSNFATVNVRGVNLGNPTTTGNASRFGIHDSGRGLRAGLHGPVVATQGPSLTGGFHIVCCLLEAKGRVSGLSSPASPVEGLVITFHHTS